MSEEQIWTEHIWWSVTLSFPQRTSVTWGIWLPFLGPSCYSQTVRVTSQMTPAMRVSSIPDLQLSMACHLMQQIFVAIQDRRDSVSNVPFFFLFLIKEVNAFAPLFSWVSLVQNIAVSSLFMKPLINANKGLYNWVILAYVRSPKSANTEFKRRLRFQCFVNCVAAKYFIIKIEFV